MGLVAICMAAVTACAGGSDTDNSTARSNAIIKIMPLGDSITESITGLNSYRYYLWHLLLNTVC